MHSYQCLYLAEMIPSVLKPSFSQNLTLCSSQNSPITSHPRLHPSSFSTSITILPNPLPRTLLHVTIFSIMPIRPESTSSVMSTVPNATTLSVFTSTPTMLTCLELVWVCCRQNCRNCCSVGLGAWVSWPSTQNMPRWQSDQCRCRNWNSPLLCFCGPGYKIEGSLAARISFYMCLSNINYRPAAGRRIIIFGRFTV